MEQGFPTYRPHCQIDGVSPRARPVVRWAVSLRDVSVTGLEAAHSIVLHLNDDTVSTCSACAAWFQTNDRFIRIAEANGFLRVSISVENISTYTCTQAYNSSRFIRVLRFDVAIHRPSATRYHDAGKHIIASFAQAHKPLRQPNCVRFPFPLLQNSNAPDVVARHW